MIQNGRFTIQRDYLMITAEEVIWKILWCLPKIPLSFPERIKQETAFFNYFEESVKKEFLKSKLYVIDKVDIF